MNTVEWLMTKHAKDGKSAEEAAILKKKEERTQARLANLIGELDSSPYGDFEDLDDEELAKIIDEDADDDGQSVLPEAYQQLVESALGGKKLDVPTLRHVLRRAGTYRIRTILPTVLQNFEHLLPVIREVVIFVERVLNDESVKRHADHFERILQSNEMKFPFVNMWVSYLFQNQHFNAIGLPANYDHFHELRDKALIARRKRDAVFVKTFKDKLDVLGPWDRRAIIYSADILSKDEMRNWTALVSAKGDILEKSICALLRSRN